MMFNSVTLRRARDDITQRVAVAETDPAALNEQQAGERQRP